MSVCKYIAGLLSHSAYGDGAGGALSTAAGFASSDLGDGSVERFWTSGAAATTHKIAIDLGSSSWTAVAVFDVRATDGTAPTDITIEQATGISGAWAGGEDITFNARGDGVLAPVGTIRRYVQLTIRFASAKTLRVGELVFGTIATLTRQFAERTDTHEGRTLENETAAGSITRARAGAVRRVLSLAFAELLEAERDEFDAMIAATSDGLEPLVLIPDSYNPTDVLHGWVPASWSEEISDPIWSGISFDFRESGRAI